MRFGVLGPLEVSNGDGPLPLGGPKQRIVLAHLVLGANTVVPAEHLIDAVWGEEPPEAAKGTLQAYISRLRSAVGSTAIEGRPPGYVLHADPDEVDALRFERLLREARGHTVEPRVIARTLGEALELWRGPALADLAGEASLVAEIARLEELHLQATEQKIAADLELGHQARVIAELEKLTRAHPLRERFWGELMLALYRVDRQADALAAYQRAREILADELGVDPSSDLQRVHERILRHDPDLDLKGEPLRGYRLLEPIGDGAFGVVYRAIQPQVGRDVAIKAVHPELANHPDFVRRFEREAQIVARLEHPHIVPLYDYWREPDAAYLVMRFLRGGSVEHLLRQGPLEPSRAAVILDHVAAALSAAHRQGVVHRDVKPGNVLLDEEGNAYLTDFGVALDAGAPEKSSGTMMRGTPAYLSPEQIRLEPATPQTDIYALGIVLYEMLAGSHPFPDISLSALLDHHVRDALPSVRQARPDLPAAVEATIAVATSKDADSRFSDALEVAAAFRAALEDVVEVHEPVELRNPFKGLRAFLEADAADFFGREALVGRLVRRMEEDEEGARFLAVVGPSGSGKSSVVRAGLVPALRRGALQGSDRWYVIDLLPGAHPLREFESALLGVAVAPPPSLLDDLELDELGLVRAVDRVLPDPEAELLIVVDQLEEVFTLVEDEDERSQVLAAIRAAVLTDESRIRIVATLRADFFDAPLQVRGFGELLAARTEAITPMALEELERAIVAPADRTGFVVEPRLLAAMITDVADRPGALPLLQYALTELAEDARGTLSLEDYRRIGGVSGALAQRAEQLFQAMREDAREACQQLFLRLVALGEGTEDTRRRVRRSELEHIAERRTLDAVIEAFGRHRLLSFDRDPESREPTVEIAHEALLRAWSRFRGWIDEARDDIRTQRWLATAATEWETSERDQSFLLRGARLEHTVSWAETSSFAMTDSDEAFLRASLAHRDEEIATEESRRDHEIALERRSVRRARALVALFAVAALVAGTLTVVATGQTERASSEATIARARELAAAAVANLEVDPELSILLATEAVDQTRSLDGSVLPEAEEVLHLAIESSRIVATIPGPGGSVLDWGPPGVFVRVGADGITSTSVEIRDSETGAIVRTLSGHDAEVTGAEFSPDGSMIAATDRDGALQVWDVASGEVLTTVAYGGLARAPTFSQDGTQVAAIWSTPSRASMRVLQVRTDRARAFPAPSGARDVAFDPLGSRIVIGGTGPEVHVIDLDTRGVVRLERPPTAWHITTLSWSPDGRFVAAGAFSSVPIWDVQTGEVRFSLSQGIDDPVSWVEWSPELPRLVTGSPHLVKIWDITDDNSSELMTLTEPEREILGVTFSPDGELLMTGSGIDRVKIWDIGPTGHAEWAGFPDASDFGFVPNTNHLIVSGTDGSVRTWRLEVGRDETPLASFEPAGDTRVADADTSPDGRSVAIWLGTDEEDPFLTEGLPVIVRDVTTGKELFSVNDRVSRLAWSTEGDLLAALLPPGQLKIFDPSGDEVWTKQVRMVYGGNIWISPDGGLVALSGLHVSDGSDGAETIRIWDWRRNRFIARIEAIDYALAFDPTGTRIATGSEGRPVIWDLESGTALVRFPVIAGDIYGLAFSPDGSRLAVVSADDKVRLFDVASREGMLLGHLDDLGQIEFSGDGTMLASGVGTIRVWALDIDDLLEIARQNVTRSLTDEECRRYLHAQACPT